MLKNLYQKLTIKIIIGIALLVRFISWPWTYHGDVSATYWWGKFSVEFGWRGFYDWLNFGGHSPPDQPMLNMYYDWIVRQIYQIFYNIFWYLNIHISIFPSKFMQWYFIEGNQFLLKIPMIIADILIIYFCYKFTKSKLIALLLAFYLPFIYNSAVWGSGDSIVNLFALGGIYFFWKKKYIPGVLFYLFSVLYKSSLIIWAPIFLIILIKNKISIKNLIFSSLFLLTLIYFISFPFSPVETHPLIWFYQTMLTKILPGFMDLITVNAMNFWALIFGLKYRIDSVLIFNLISIRVVSLAICSVFYFYTLIKLYKNYSQKYLLLTLVNISLITFTFMTRMHERYSYPALIPLLLLCYYDRKYTKYFIILSITHFLNIFAVWGMPNIVFIHNLLNDDFIIRFISLVNTIITLKLVFSNPLRSNTNNN